MRYILILLVITSAAFGATGYVVIEGDLLTGAGQLFTDYINLAALDSSAIDGYDELWDVPDPAPPPGSYLQIYFPHSEWGSVFGDNFAVDVRNGNDDLTDEVKIYNFYVDSDLEGETLDLLFEISPDYPEELGVVLHDIESDSYQNIRENDEFSLTIGQDIHEFNLRLGDGTPPEINITFPLPDTLLYVGYTYDITWECTDITPIRYFKVYYSIDDGINWTLIDSLAGEELICEWVIPDTSSEEVKIKIEAEDWAGNLGEEITVYTFRIDLGIEDRFINESPAEFKLYPAFPNPFNPSTKIAFSLPLDAEVKLVVYDIQGKERVILCEGMIGRGINEVIFDASDLPTGMYFVRMMTDSYTQTQKLLLVK